MEEHQYKPRQPGTEQPVYAGPRKKVYEVDLTKIGGEGDFPCPRCGVIISPSDETEDVYRVIETKIKGQALEELGIQCNKCGSRIRLIGFLVPETEEIK